jgi:hypothetical protein
MPEPTAVPETACINCRKPFSAGHYRVVKVNQAGADTGTVRVCSVVCLIQWAYAYGTQMGARIVSNVRNVNLRDVLAGIAQSITKGS